MARDNLSRAARLYVSCVILAGLSTVAASTVELYAHPVGYQWFVLAALTIISGSATVKLPSVPAELTVSETFVFTAVLLFGAPAGTLIVALDGLIFSIWSTKRGITPIKLLFNVAAPALSIWLSAKLFFLLAGIRPLIYHSSTLSEFVLPLIVFTALYFALNSWLITWAVALETRSRPVRIWRQNFAWVSLNFLCGASVAALLTVYPLRGDSGSTNLTFLTYVGAVIPLLLVLYLTFRTSMARVEDANRHLAEMNQIYLSTIETLAMAVDAKDQVTHGHIRRVQTYATRLAKALGIRDSGLLKAIEAASLLHDMGKLAVPEHILNKPGKLTAAEFDKMKLHASIGADILSSIHFPYPVIPIVRHHHENWDGSGYPDGLNGSDIPVGARILSVVDCFDALTSDRPYRPRLPSEEALKILRQRRGNMYDPLVVDTFIRIFATLAASEPSDAKPPHPALIELTRSIGDNRSSDAGQGPDWPGSPKIAGIVAVSRAAASLSSTGHGADAIALLGPYLRTLIRSDLIILSAYATATDTLEVVHVEGAPSSCLVGWSAAVGERLSGWVAATKQCVFNSAAALEFGGTRDSFLLTLQSALVVPVIDGNHFVGVMGFYSKTASVFSASDRFNAQLLAVHLGPLLARFASRTTDASQVTITPVESLERVLQSSAHVGADRSQALIMVRTDSQLVSAVLLRSLLTGLLRESDIVASGQEREIVILLSGSTPDVAARMTSRISFELRILLPTEHCAIAGPVLIPSEAPSVSHALVIAQKRLRDSSAA